MTERETVTNPGAASSDTAAPPGGFLFQFHTLNLLMAQIGTCP